MAAPTSTPLPPERIAELGLPDAEAVCRVETRARTTFRRVVPSPDSVSVEARQYVADSARFLEQLCVLAAVGEAAEVLGIQTFRELVARAREVVSHATAIARLNLLDPFLSDPAFVKFVEHRVAEGHQPDPDALISTRPEPHFVRSISSLVELCPIEELVAIGEAADMAGEAHRCRVSHEWLRAYVRRYRSGQKETSHIIGRAYAEGRLSLDEAANLLGMPISDAVAWLEDYGHARNLQVLRMTPANRAAALARIRRDRLSRAGHPRVDPALISRDVLATQRIEGVDARPWVHPNG